MYEPVYLAGIAAGKATKSNKLGYVYAFPIPQTIDNINAFQLGAQSVNPDAKTYVVNTSNWCDPAKQAEAAKSLLDQGVDVITQHQDCTSTITKATEEAGAMVVGYHADASELAPKGWVTGSEWDWGDLYTDIVEDGARRRVHRQQVQRQLPGRLQDRRQPVRAVEVRADRSTAETKATDRRRPRRRSRPTGSPFAGPVDDQDGTVMLSPPARCPTTRTIEATTTVFVEGRRRRHPEELTRRRERAGRAHRPRAARTR